MGRKAVSYQFNGTIGLTGNVVQNPYSRGRRQFGCQFLNERDRKILTLARTLDIAEKERDIVTADHTHDTLWVVFPVVFIVGPLLSSVV